MPSTHTYATLEVPASLINELRTRIAAAYGNVDDPRVMDYYAFEDGGLVLPGVALIPAMGSKPEEMAQAPSICDQLETMCALQGFEKAQSQILLFMDTVTLSAQYKLARNAQRVADTNAAGG